MILRHIVNWNGALNVNMQIFLFCQIVMNKTGYDQFQYCSEMLQIKRIKMK